MKQDQKGPEFATPNAKAKSEAIRAGQLRARAAGRRIGRPRRMLDCLEVARLRNEEKLSWPEIARRVGAGVGTVVRAYRSPAQAAGKEAVPRPFQNSPGAHL